MKKSLTIIALLAGATGAYAQGLLNWGDYVSGFTVDIFSPQTVASVQQTGQMSLDNPSGTTVYQGVPIGGSTGGEVSGGIAYGNGANFEIALFAAPGSGNNAGIAAALLANTPLTTTTFQTSGGIGLANAGANSSGNNSAGDFAGGSINGSLPIPNAPGGTPATFMLAAWYNPGGDTYASPALSPISGLSEIETVGALGGVGTYITPTLGQSLPAGGQPAGDSRITSFSLVEVPEPSTIALGVIGASTFLFRRRK